MTCFPTVLLVLVTVSPQNQARDRTKRFLVSPAKAPTPALRYELLPDLRDQSPGNAAIHYLRATSSAFHHDEPATNDELARWMGLPIADLPKRELQWLNDYLPLRELEAGARKEHCDWELVSVIRTKGLRASFPEVGPLRQICMLLLLRARLELSEGKFAEAVHGLQTGFSVARHLNEAPSIVWGLVGHGIAGITLDEIERIIQQQGAPNLYWALTSLPVPLADLSAGMQGDRLVMTNLLPDFDRLRDTVLTVEEARKVLYSHYHNHGGLPKALEGPQGLGALFPTALVTRNYSRAKQYLLANGWPAEKVEATPAPQVVLLYAGLRLRIAQDEALKWRHVPYWQARPKIRDSLNEIESQYREAEGSLPFLDVGTPVDKFLQAVATLDRRIAMLRCVEAIRLHAAANDGRLPTKLEDITSVPIPMDPVTGKAFVYSVEEGKAILSSLPVEDEPRISERYEITIRK